MPGDDAELEDLQSRLREATERRDRQNRLRDGDSDDYDYFEWERAQRDVELLERRIRAAGGAPGGEPSPGGPALDPSGGQQPSSGGEPLSDELPDLADGDPTKPLVDRVREARRRTEEVRGRRPETGARRDIEGGGVEGGTADDLTAQTEWRAELDAAEEAQAAAEGELAFEAGGGDGAFTDAERRRLQDEVREIQADQQELDAVNAEIARYEQLLDEARGLLHGDQEAGGGPSAGGGAGIAAGARYQGELRTLYRRQAEIVERMNGRLEELARSILEKARRLIGRGADRLDLDIHVPAGRNNRTRAEEELLRRIYRRLGLPDLPGRGAGGLLGTGRRHRGFSLAPRPAMLIALVLLVLLGLVATVLLLSGDDEGPVATAGESASDTGDTGDPGTDGTVTNRVDDEATEPARATAVAVGVPCAIVTHQPPPGHPTSLSYFEVAAVLVGVDGTLGEGRTLTAEFTGADAPFTAAVATDGLVAGVVPISSHGSYPLAGATLTGGEGPEVDATEALQAALSPVEVGPSEGPVGGCTDPRDLTADARAAATAYLARDPADDQAASGDELPRIRAFLTEWLAAHDVDDTGYLLATLDAATIERYGTDQCAAYLDDVVGSVERIEVLDGRAEPYGYDLDGRSTIIADAWTVTVELWVTGSTDATVTDIHLHPTPEGVRWLTDCGDPV